MISVRAAKPEDAGAMSEILTEILVSWASDRPRSAAHVLSKYIEHPDRVRCSVALGEDGAVLGFQSLQFATEGNPYDLPVGWGVIGTYVSAKASRRGVGRALFASSLAAAKSAELSEIDATIADKNETALNYYDAMGFRTYKTQTGAICKKRMVP